MFISVARLCTVASCKVYRTMETFMSNHQNHSIQLAVWKHKVESPVDVLSDLCMYRWSINWQTSFSSIQY